MNTHYDVEEWAAETTRGRQIFNYGYRLAGKEFKGWRLLKVVSLQEGANVTQKIYLWQSISDPERAMFRVDIAERPGWRLAQESLHEYLMRSMRADIPRGTKRLAQLGDINFVGRAPQSDIAGAISFARANVFVSVSSAGEKNVDVSDAATLIDRALSEPPAKREIEKGRVRVLSPKTATITANKAHVLIENLQKAAPRGKWLKIIVPDGELSRRGDALIYLSDQGGKKVVRTFAINGN